MFRGNTAISELLKKAQQNYRYRIVLSQNELKERWKHMGTNEEKFNPKLHICKLGFELYDYATFNSMRYNIIGNLYEKEILFEFIDKKTEEVVEVFGYKISEDKFRSLLPLVYWEDFEKYRDLPENWEWEYQNGHAGYRDGWGYRFWCLSENGYPLLQVYMNCFFLENKLPAYEKLLKWLRDNYKKKKNIGGINMLW